MKKTTACFAGFLLFGRAAGLSGQDPLTLDQALEIGLANNHAIRIARASARIDRNNATPGNAGMLPLVSLSAGRTRSVNDSRQEYVTGAVNTRDGAESSTLNAGASLNWTLFDGFQMFTTYARLRRIRESGEWEERLAVEATVQRIVETYSDVVVQQQKIESLREQAALSEKRLRLAASNLETGSGSRLDWLNARVDLNADRSSLFRQEIAVERAKTALNELLARPADSPFSASDSLALRRGLEPEALRAAARSGSSEMRIARAIRAAARMDVRGAYAPLLPRVGLSVGYTLSQSESQAGFFKYNRNIGLTYGLSASLALFDGFNLHRRIGNARLALRQTEWALDETVNRMDAQVVRAFKRYETNLRISDLEQENLAAARESVSAAMERYRLGGLSALELRDAQVKLLEATDRLFSARYEAKVAETELLRMSGTLLREGP